MSRATTATMTDRATGALLGMALGDALGMPSQTLSRREIFRRYGTIADFCAPFDGHPVSHGLGAAHITDDTEQALILANQLVAANGVFDERQWAENLLQWETSVTDRGLHDLLGPSTKRALEALVAGIPSDLSGKDGTTNGAAMRIAPIGIATPIEPLAALVDRVEETCRVTHNTGEAIAAASAVAAVISAGVSGASFEAAVPVALAAARDGAGRGFAKGERDIAARISQALESARTGPDPGDFADMVGTSVASYQSVSAAFGIVRLAGSDPWRAAQISANIGDDTDTIGAISAAMAGACAGAGSLPADKVATVCRVNNLDLTSIVAQLLELRRRASLSLGATGAVR